MEQPASSYGTPGRYLKALLKERGWTIASIAVVLNMSEDQIKRITADRRPITAEIAIALHEVFGVRAEDFLSLQKSYDLAKARIAMPPNPERNRRARLYGGYPIREMIKRRWISAENVKDFAAVESGLAAFFGVKAPEEVPSLPHAARRSPSAQEVTLTQLAWIQRVRSIAGEMLVKRFVPRLAKAAITKLTALRLHPEQLREVPRIMMESGIRFVVVESLAAAKIDGVCFWLDEWSPVIGMSLRYDRIDNFWFVLRHELEHVIRKHGMAKPVVDTELEGERAGVGADVNEEERIPNAAAAEFCVPASHLSAFIERKDPFYAERDLLGFAKTIGVHPGLVVGQLQHKTDRYDLFRKHLVPVRKFVAPAAIADGWGDVVPVGNQQRRRKTS